MIWNQTFNLCFLQISAERSESISKDLFSMGNPRKDWWKTHFSTQNTSKAVYHLFLKPEVQSKSVLFIKPGVNVFCYIIQLYTSAATCPSVLAEAKQSGCSLKQRKRRKSDFWGQRSCLLSPSLQSITSLTQTRWQVDSWTGHPQPTAPLPSCVG